MSAFIPSRKTPEINEGAFDKVRADKERESNDGFDGSWVAHPDLVEIARGPFEEVLGGRDHQVDNKREDVSVTAEQLLDIRVPDGQITEDGLRNNVSVGIQYISSWLMGNGAAAIFNLMEDAATAEISRSQVWQWVHNGATTSDGQKITKDLVQRVIEEELEKIKDSIGDEAFAKAPAKEAQTIFEEVALSDRFVEFLTLSAYDYLD
jgi:malate synthase